MIRDESEGIITSELEAKSFFNHKYIWQTIPQAGEIRCKALVFCDGIDYVYKNLLFKQATFQTFEYTSRQYAFYEHLNKSVIAAEDFVNRAVKEHRFRKKETLSSIVEQLFSVLVPQEIVEFKWGLFNLEYFQQLLTFREAVLRNTKEGPSQEELLQKIRSTSLFQKEGAMEEVGRMWYSYCIGGMTTDKDLTQDPKRFEMYLSQLNCIKLITGAVPPPEYVQRAYNELDALKKEIEEIFKVKDN